VDKGGGLVFLFGLMLGFGKRKERRDGRGERLGFLFASLSPSEKTVEGGG
jgi:hypothetical protein